jgi:hypothetical protein
MVVIKLTTCSSCNYFIQPKVDIINGELSFDNLCKFCRKREEKIKKIEQKILDLEYQLFKMRDQTI